MALRTRLTTGILLGFTVITSALPIAVEAEAKGFDDYHYNKIEAIKLAKLKKAKKHHLHQRHHGHVYTHHNSFPRRSRRVRRARRSRRSFGHRFLFKHH